MNENAYISDSGETYITVDTDDPATCEGCAFRGETWGFCCENAPCTEDARDDKRNVIWVAK